jgi:hypothetical protein
MHISHSDMNRQNVDDAIAKQSTAAMLLDIFVVRDACPPTVRSSNGVSCMGHDFALELPKADSGGRRIVRFSDDWHRSSWHIKKFLVDHCVLRKVMDSRRCCNNGKAFVAAVNAIALQQVLAEAPPC